MNAKLCKKLRKIAHQVNLPERKHEVSRDHIINQKETDRGLYRHLKRNAREILDI